MVTANKKCRVCDEEYEYCHTAHRVAGVFRWQDVACCPEHGSIYLAKIQASRAGEPVEDKVAAKDVDVAEASMTNFNDLSECDGEDEWFEDDFNDDAEETAINK